MLDIVTDQHAIVNIVVVVPLSLYFLAGISSGLLSLLPINQAPSGFGTLGLGIPWLGVPLQSHLIPHSVLSIGSLLSSFQTQPRAHPISCEGPFPTT